MRLHPLDGVPILARWLLSILFAAIPLGGLYALASWWRWAPVIAAPLIAPLVIPLLTPLFVDLRIFRYRSRFLLLMPRLGGGFTMHLGTGLDLLVHGRRMSNVMLLVSVIEGLVAIGDDAAEGRMRADTVLEATSDVFSQRTARMLGFDVAHAKPLDRLLFAIGWIDASLWRSVRAGRLIPALLSRVMTARTTAGRLAGERSRLADLLVRLHAKDEV